MFILAFALGCALSSSYGFLSGAWPFGVVEAIWTFSFRRYLLAGRPGRAAPSHEPGRPQHGGATPADASTAWAAARRATGTRKGEQLT